MTKKIISLFLILSMVFALFSCFLPNGGGGNEGGDENAIQTPSLDDENCIFGPNSSVVIVKSETDRVSDVYPITSRVYSLSNKFAVVEPDSLSKKEREIVVGNTSRDISLAASQRLSYELDSLFSEYEAAGRYSILLGGFAIYADSRSVAIVWSNDETANIAINYFVENYLTSESLVLPDGHFEFVPHDRSDDIIAEQEAEQDAAWAEAEAEYGSELVEAIRKHLALFDDRFYLWLADLYEPSSVDLEGNVIGGGFYYSNSARDNDSYAGVSLLPDLESTSQVLSFLTKSGMMASTSFKEVLPEELRNQIIDFARALQSPEDGYFYHPQWGKNISTSRRSRDCGWGATILTRLGSRPYWDTPSGTAGIYGPPGSQASLVMPLGVKVSLSAAIAIASTDLWTGAEHLKTLKAWESYLINITSLIHINSYSIGNTLSSQTAQINNRDKLALKTGELVDSDKDGFADGGYIETYRRIMDEKQMENGLWESTVSYNSVNGLMKISGSYSNLGLAINRADKAVLCAAEMVISDIDPDGITDVYNPWVALNALLNNITNYGSSEQSESLREIIKSNACEMVGKTTEKVAKFAREDGSYSYNQDGSPYKSQGAIVAVRYTEEGDVNGGTIAYTGIFSSMCGVLELDILPLGFADLIKFVEALDYTV